MAPPSRSDGFGIAFPSLDDGRTVTALRAVVKPHRLSMGRVVGATTR